MRLIHTKVGQGLFIESEVPNNARLELCVLSQKSPVLLVAHLFPSFPDLPLNCDTFILPLDISIDPHTVVTAVESESGISFNAVSSFWAAFLHFLY